MKVTFVAPYYLPLSIGGFQIQVYSIFEKMKNLGVDVQWFNVENSSLDDVDVLQVMSTDPSMLSLMKRAKSKGLKVVLTPMQGSRAKSDRYLKGCLALSRIPQVCSMHRLTANTIRCADYLTPLCSFEAMRMANVYGIKDDSITVIPNGLNDVFFNEDVSEVKLPYKDYLLIIGRVEENKNQSTLIDAVNAVGLNLIVVGEPGNEGPAYLEGCQRKAGNNVNFWGIEKDAHILKYLYRNAALTVIPSFSEMVPLVAFESLSQGTPVVCTNRCGIADDDIPGLFFSDIDKNSLIKSISTARSFDRRQITQEGIYTWTDIAKMYVEVYEKLCK